MKVLGLITVSLAFCIAISACNVASYHPANLENLRSLKPPFDVEARRVAFGKPVSRFDCPPPPTPVRDLEFGGFYIPGSSSSEVDPKALDTYRKATRPIVAYENFITQVSDSYLRSNPAEGSLARCVLDWLYTWAKGSAMLGAASQQGGFVRKWGLVPVSASYLKIREDKSLDKPRKIAVEEWIGRWAWVVKTDYSTETHRASRRNNHLYWASLAATLAAVALNNRDLLDWGVAQYRFALTQIQADGTLPLELARRSKALHYHLFSIPPLVLVAETAAQNGFDLYAERDGALHKLIRRTVAGLDDPAYFERLTGEKQTWVGRLDGGKLAWIEAYYARYRDKAPEKWIVKFRPLVNRQVGGDATLLYGLPKLARD